MPDTTPETTRGQTVEVIEVEEEPHPNPLQAIAQQQVEYVVIATSTVATTIFTVLASAAGLVAALAWNTALSSWLPTVIKLDDRGSSQTIGLVTDVEPFLRSLVSEVRRLEGSA